MEYMAAMGIVAGAFVFLVGCAVLLLIGIIDNACVHIKRARLRRNRGQ
jgi:hypothetical protein